MATELFIHAFYSVLGSTPPHFLVHTPTLVTTVLFFTSICLKVFLLDSTQTAFLRLAYFTLHTARWSKSWEFLFGGAEPHQERLVSGVDRRDPVDTVGGDGDLDAADTVVKF